MKHKFVSAGSCSTAARLSSQVSIAQRRVNAQKIVMMGCISNSPSLLYKIPYKPLLRCYLLFLKNYVGAGEWSFLPPFLDYHIITKLIHKTDKRLYAVSFALD